MRLRNPWRSYKSRTRKRVYLRAPAFFAPHGPRSFLPAGMGHPARAGAYLGQLVHTDEAGPLPCRGAGALACADGLDPAVHRLAGLVAPDGASHRSAAAPLAAADWRRRSEEHTSVLQSRENIVSRPLRE